MTWKRAKSRIDRFQRAPDELHVQLRGVLHVADGAAGLEERAPGHAAQAGQLKGHTVQNGFLLSTYVSGMCINKCPFKD